MSQLSAISTLSIIFGSVNHFAVLGSPTMPGFISAYLSHEFWNNFMSICFSSGVFNFARVSFIFFASVSLGANALYAGVKAGALGFAIVALFLILWYRVPGFIATLALVLYVLISLALFKLIPVTLTAAGLAGFILSIGMAVDANILIFERMKEELRAGKNLHDALHEGFHRAWLSIRDSNVSSMITALVLFWLGTSAVKGFALTFGLGVLISMFTAITASRTFLFAISNNRTGRITKFLFGSGLK